MGPLVVLGATGSVGRQALEVAAALEMPVVGLAAGSPSETLISLAGSHPDAELAVAGGDDAERRDFARRVGRPVSFGPEAVADLAGRAGNTVLNGVVGSAGLASTLSALEAGNRVALANKESMVAAGELVRKVLERTGSELIPVDSEHSAIHQCMAGEPPSAVSALVLTASGGPFRGRDPRSFADVTPQEALAHPTWDMGGRITIDSATLMNKGLEVIEAHHLFGVEFDRIEVVVHPQSILHSAVRFTDGALKAHLGNPDMRVPVQYALTYPQRASNLGAEFGLAGLTLDFEEPDRRAFPALDLAYSAGRAGGVAPAVLNAADEVAVAAFLEGRIGFLSIVSVVEETLERVGDRSVSDVSDVMAADDEARARASELVGSARYGR